MTPAEIKKTRLYRTLAPCVRKEDREDLARRLAAVFKVKQALFDGHSERLIAAFCFADSAEGHAYWGELRDRLMKAGHECW